METVFLDTVGLIALWDKSDQWHLAADAAFSKINVSKVKIVATTCILMECGNAASRRPYRNEVPVFAAQLESGNLLVHPNESDWHQAWAAYARGDADRAGIVDQISFVVMRCLGIVKAFTNDSHYHAAGFVPLF